MTRFLALHCQDESPEALVERAWRKHRKQSTAPLPPLIVVVTFSFAQYWQEGSPSLKLTAVYCCVEEAGGNRISLSVTDRADRIVELLSNHDTEVDQRVFAELLDKAGLPCFSDVSLLPLQTVHIPKPWGREIWYTGIEARGVAGIGAPGCSIPLPWLLAALPGRLCRNRERALILLKILDPLPEPVFGDLYFELHREKREVYVVTSVDKEAWPDGVGAIRYGFDPRVVDRYDSDATFKAAYVQAVKCYEAVRREIDQQVDELRRRDGIGLNTPVDAQTLKQWLAAIPQALTEQEARLRAEMDAFTRELPLRVGDVVKVPTLTPHSLQHGVRTIEFQTPVYERLIVSFAQKVVTQAHWDTDAAAALMDVAPPEQPPHELVYSDNSVKVERIVDFEDFEVLRATLAGGGSYLFTDDCDYCLVIVVSGELAVGGTTLQAEQAALLPAEALRQPLLNRCNMNDGNAGLTFLVARPK